MQVALQKILRGVKHQHVFVVYYYYYMCHLLFVVEIIYLNCRFIRNNRKWTYDTIHCEGTDPVIKNPLMKES